MEITKRTNQLSLTCPSTRYASGGARGVDSNDGLCRAVVIPGADHDAQAFGQVRAEWAVAGGAEFEAAFGGLGLGPAQGGQDRESPSTRAGLLYLNAGLRRLALTAALPVAKRQAPISRTRQPGRASNWLSITATTVGTEMQLAGLPPGSPGLVVVDLLAYASSVVASGRNRWRGTVRNACSTAPQRRCPASAMWSTMWTMTSPSTMS